MLKITTKRDRYEEEALRQEGRDEANQATLSKALQQIYDRQSCQADVFHAGDVKAGDVFAAYSVPRSFYRAAKVLRAESTYSDGRPCKPGHVWITYEPFPSELGFGGSSLLADNDPVLLEVKS